MLNSKLALWILIAIILIAGGAALYLNYWDKPPVDEAAKIFIYNNGQTITLDIKIALFASLQRNIVLLAKETYGSFLLQNLSSDIFDNVRKSDYAVGLAYSAPRKIRIGANASFAYEPRTEGGLVLKLLIPFTDKFLPRDAVCVNEEVCLNQSSSLKYKVLSLIDAQVPGFLPGLDITKMSEEFGRAYHVKRTHGLCEYENSPTVCGVLLVNMRDDITQAELNNIAAVANASSGRVVSFSIDLRSFTMEFDRDPELFAAKKNLAATPGVVFVGYDVVLEPL